MSELLHSGQLPGAPGQHPGADQLSAFLERALPAHERQQVLAHLAVCQDCRETVALSLPNLEAPQQPVPEPPLRRWFHGWRIFAPAALVFAASVVILVSVHHTKTTGSVVNQAGQIATSQPPAPALPPVQTPALHAVAPAEPKPQSVNRLTPTARLDERGQKDALDKASPAAMQALPQAAPAPPPSASIASQEAKTAAPKTEMYSPTPAPVQSQAAVPPPPAGALAGSAAQTVEVQSNAPLLDTTTSNLQLELQPSTLRTVVLKHPLPGGQQPLSVAASGKLILAIDAHNRPFLSRDDGKHWTAIDAPWQSRAVKVDLVLQSSSPAPVSSESGNFASMNGRMVAFADASPSGASLTGVVTDTSVAVIPHATVTIRNAATGAERTLITDASGRYLANNLAPGNYTIDAEAAGFEERHVNAIAVDASKQRVENLTLRVGASSETVEVSAESATVPAAPAARDKTLKSHTAAPAQPVFTITTDTGEHWTSPDGIAWQRQ